MNLIFFKINISSKSDLFLNKYFIEIGPKLSENINMPCNQSFEDYLLNPVQTLFDFKKSDSEAVIKAIDSLKPKTSSVQDRISNELLKYITANTKTLEQNKIG